MAILIMSLMRYVTHVPPLLTVFMTQSRNYLSRSVRNVASSLSLPVRPLSLSFCIFFSTRVIVQLVQSPPIVLR